MWHGLWNDLESDGHRQLFFVQHIQRSYVEETGLVLITAATLTPHRDMRQLTIILICLMLNADDSVEFYVSTIVVSIKQFYRIMSIM